MATDTAGSRDVDSRAAIARIRNVGIVAHIDAGKTTTTERILFYTGVSDRLGEVHDGTSVMDWLRQEQERGITICAGSVSCEWSGSANQFAPHWLNLIDTPGHVDFVSEVERSLHVLDGAVIVVCAVAGVQSQTEAVWRQADRLAVPRIVFVNKLDREGADVERVLDQLRSRLGATPVLLQWPLDDGFVDLPSGQALVARDHAGLVYETVAVPAALQARVDQARDALCALAAEASDELTERYVSGEVLSADDLLRALRQRTLRREVVPVVLGAALRNRGVRALLDAVVDLLPSPLDANAVPARGAEGETIALPVADDSPFAGLVFRTQHDATLGELAFVRVYAGQLRSGDVVQAADGVLHRALRLVRVHANDYETIERVGAGDIAAIVGIAALRSGDTLCAEGRPLQLATIVFPEPVLAVAVEARDEQQLAVLDAALTALCRDDPSLRRESDAETGQTLLAGMGELHLDVVITRLRDEFGLDLRLGPPRVAYREQPGGVTRIELPVSSSTGAVELHMADIAAEHIDARCEVTLQGELPPMAATRLIAAAHAALQHGGPAGHPCAGVRVTLRIADYHCAPSEDARVAAGLAAAIESALREALARCRCALLEPVMAVEVTTPEEFIGVVLGELNRRRGVIRALDEQLGRRVVTAQVPLAELFGYATSLRSASQGRATFEMAPSHYARVPAAVAERITRH